MGDFERKSGEGGWLVTYGDLVTLLLVFFVMLYVMTPGIKKSAFNDFVSYFQSSNSVIAEKSRASKQADENKLKEEWQQIKSFLKERGLQSQVAIKKISDGVKVTLSDSLTFNSGSAKLLPKAKVVLNEIANAFDTEVRNVTVEGHTDNVPIAEPSKYETNWHLGAARAVSVIVFMRERAELNPARYEASSFGEYRPVASNATEEGRRKNRRIEIYVRYKGAGVADSLSVTEFIKRQ